jgi:hypothetical protein
MREELKALTDKYGFNPVLHELLFLAAKKLTPFRLGLLLTNEKGKELADFLYKLDVSGD